MSIQTDAHNTSAIVKECALRRAQSKGQLNGFQQSKREFVVYIPPREEGRQEGAVLRKSELLRAGTPAVTSTSDCSVFWTRKSASAQHC